MVNSYCKRYTTVMSQPWSKPKVSQKMIGFPPCLHITHYKKKTVTATKKNRTREYATDKKSRYSSVIIFCIRKTIRTG